jgi:hypothetical protein
MPLLLLYAAGSVNRSMQHHRGSHDEGSEIVWEDRETLLYQKGELTVFVWVVFGSLFFGRSRVIKLESLRRRHGTNEPISDEQRNEIVAKIREYFGTRPVRVE